jgi:hypothetical protein
VKDTIAIILMYVTFIAACFTCAAHASEPKIFWGEREVVMDCQQIVHARVVLMAIMSAARNEQADSCQFGTADCYAESLMYDTALDLDIFLADLYLKKCAEASLPILLVHDPPVSAFTTPQRKAPLQHPS